MSRIMDRLYDADLELVKNGTHKIYVRGTNQLYLIEKETFKRYDKKYIKRMFGKDYKFEVIKLLEEK